MPRSHPPTLGKCCPPRGTWRHPVATHQFFLVHGGASSFVHTLLPTIRLSIGAIPLKVTACSRATCRHQHSSHRPTLSPPPAGCQAPRAPPSAQPSSPITLISITLVTHHLMERIERCPHSPRPCTEIRGHFPMRARLSSRIHSPALPGIYELHRPCRSHITRRIHVHAPVGLCSLTWLRCARVPRPHR